MLSTRSVRHWSNLHSCLPRWELFLSPSFYRWANWGLGRLSNCQSHFVDKWWEAELPTQALILFPSQSSQKPSNGITDISNLQIRKPRQRRNILLIVTASEQQSRMRVQMSLTHANATCTWTWMLQGYDKEGTHLSKLRRAGLYFCLPNVMLSLDCQLLCIRRWMGRHQSPPPVTCGDISWDGWNTKALTVDRLTLWWIHKMIALFGSGKR